LNKPIIALLVAIIVVLLVASNIYTYFAAYNEGLSQDVTEKMIEFCEKDMNICVTDCMVLQNAIANMEQLEMPNQGK